MINRSLANSLEEIVKHFPVILLTRLRQIRKSALLSNKFFNNNFSYVSLDNQFYLMMAKNDPNILGLHTVPTIIDETQKAPELFPYIKTIVNKTRLEK